MTNITLAYLAPFLPIASAYGAVFVLDYWIYKNDPRPRKSLKVINHISSLSSLRSRNLEVDTPDHTPTALNSTAAQV
jgi:hypothetical protein